MQIYANHTPYSPNTTCCVTSRHVTTRYLAHAFWYRKKPFVLCRACRTASATQHVTARHNTSRRAQGARHIRHHERDRRDTQLSLFVMCTKL